MKRYGCRQIWQDEAEWFSSPMGWCPIDGGYYKKIFDSEEYGHNDEMNDRLMESWREAGWVAAELISNKPCPSSNALPDTDVSDIPF